MKRTNYSVIGALSVGILAAVTLVACSDSGEVLPPVTTAGHPNQNGADIDGEAVRNGVTYDYDVLQSVGEVAEVSPYVITGRVAAWHDGPVVYDQGDGTYYGVLEMEPEQVFIAPDGKTHDRFYVAVLRGTMLADEDGEPIPLRDPEAEYTALSLEELTEAIPVGSKGIVLAEEISFEDPENTEYTGRLVQEWNPKASGSPLLIAHPQGLLFETEDGGFESASAEQSDVTGGEWPASDAGGGGFELLIKELESRQK
ncbi:MAG: hypothetical protein ACK5LO_07840 [Leucobacter sp.]